MSIILEVEKKPQINKKKLQDFSVFLIIPYLYNCSKTTVFCDWIINFKATWNDVCEFCRKSKTESFREAELHFPSFYYSVLENQLQTTPNLFYVNAVHHILLYNYFYV